MLASARERHPRQSVGHIRLLSSPFRPGGGGEGLGERGGMNKALKRLQSHPARLLNDFYAASPCWTCVRSYQRCSNSYAATPTLTTNPSPAPPGGSGEPTALCPPLVFWQRRSGLFQFHTNRICCCFALPCRASALSAASRLSA